ncbi:MAG: ribosomal-processing cysteine protease Prp [Treponemataceae bacterium]
MIVAEVSLDEAGIVFSCSIEGHSGAGPRGSDIVCAAVSILARTALTTLSNMEGVVVSANAPHRGVLGFVVEKAPENGAAPAGASAFLVEGLRSVARDYPDFCIVRVRTERRQDNGN